jgi:hypothetical protein
MPGTSLGLGAGYNETLLGVNPEFVSGQLSPFPHPPG